MTEQVKRWRIDADGKAIADDRGPWVSASDAAVLEEDAAWGAHNGGAHQLLKIQHATSVELYNALREMSPNHAVVVKHYELSPEALSGTGGACAKQVETLRSGDQDA